MEQPASLLRRTLRQPLAVAVLAVVIGSLILRVVRPEMVTWAKNDFEGGLEDLSHGVLLLTVLAWLVATVRMGGAPRALGALLSVYCFVLMMEEIDWGQVYGVDLGYRWLEGNFGRAAMHHNQVRPPTMFHDRLVWFASPAVLWAAASLWSAARRRLSPALPPPEVGLSFLMALGAYGFTDLLSAGIHNAYQVIAYLILLSAGVRAGRAPGTSPGPR